MLPAAPGLGHIVNKATAANMLGLSVVTFDNWVRKGLAFTKQGREVLFNLADVVRFIETEATARASATNPVAVDIEQSKARKMAAEAALAELELQRRRGEVVQVSEVVAEVSAEYTAVRAKLLAIPSKLAARLATEDGESACHRIVADAVHDALTDLCADAEARSAEIRAASNAA